MNISPNIESNLTIPFLEPIESDKNYDTINAYFGQDIDVNSYIISHVRNFESEPVNEFYYHFDQGYTSIDI
jgi:hypothetical protein